MPIKYPFAWGRRMRLFAFVLAIVIVLVSAAAVVYTRRGDGPPRYATVREILADPEWYNGRLVVVGTSGMQPGSSHTELVYRKFAGQAPILVVEFAQPQVRQPVVIIGRVRTGTPITITDCRPHP